MNESGVREKEKTKSAKAGGLVDRALLPQPVKMIPREKSVKTKTLAGRQKEKVEHHLQEEHKDDERFQHELAEMKEVHDLDEIDDDVEAEATLYEWYAMEHEHRPKSPVWFAAMAAGTTLLIGIQLFMLNFFGAITLAFAGSLIYFIAQRKPEISRYRIMLDGIAINNLLYHWQDLRKFNVVYEPDEGVKTVIFLSKKLFSPYIHMEVGDADPVDIRAILIEFLEEDQEMDEPLSDMLARRLGF